MESSVSHDHRFLVDYSQKLSPSQTEFRRAFDGSDEAFHKALLDYVLAIQGARTPRDVFRLEEHPDMPMAYMSSPPFVLNFLQSLVLMRRPRKILEIGTFIGLSALSMASAMEDGGEVVTCEKYESFAEVARRNIAANDLAHRISVLVGDAKETLAGLTGQTFDMVFIDGDKGAYDLYFQMVDPLVGRGGLIVIDDMIFHGDALNPTPGSEKGAGVKRMAELAATAANYHRTMLPLANGMLLMVKVA